MITDHLLFRSKQTLILATPAGIVEVFSVIICGYYSDKKVTNCTAYLSFTFIDEHRESACCQLSTQLSRLFLALVSLALAS